VPEYTFIENQLIASKPLNIFVRYRYTKCTVLIQFVSPEKVDKRN